MDSAAFEKIAASARCRQDMWVSLIHLMQIRRMAEVGVWRGEFAEATLRDCPEVQKYFMIDPWRRLDRWKKPMNVDDHTFQEVFDEALRRTAFAGERRIILRGTTLEVIDEIPNASLDLVYVDGDHTLRGATIDFIACYGKVKPGCYVGGDDFSRTIWQHSPKFEPSLVFPYAVYFAEAVGATIYCLPFNQFLLRKFDSGQRKFAMIDFTGKYEETDLLPQLSPRGLVSHSYPGKVLNGLRRALKLRRN